MTVFDQVDVIVRNDNAALIRLLKQSEFASRLNMIVSPDTDKGMSASLISGIKANSNADAWLIGLADMPFIHGSVIASSCAALESNALITLPTFRGKQGHPVGFAYNFLSALLSLRGDKGAREIISSSPDSITFIDSPDNGILMDIDTRQEFRKSHRIKEIL